MSSLAHWQQIWVSSQASDVSWYEPTASQSLKQILASGIGRERAVIDVGGGASTLVDGLLDAGFDDITVIDLAEEGMAQARHRLGAAAAAVHWQRADVTELALGRRFSLWHDRAVFHFLTGARERAAYKVALLSHLAEDGQVVLGTFALDGPARCSGLPVQRYSHAALVDVFAPELVSVGLASQRHATPNGSGQAFTWVRLQRASTVRREAAAG